MIYTATQYFYKLSKIDIVSFFERFVYFTNNYYGNFVDYYSGNDTLSKESYDYFNELQKDSVIIEETFHKYRDQFSANTEYIDLYESFMNVNIKIETIRNTDKWVRSSVSKSSIGTSNIDVFSNQTKIGVFINSGDTMEALTSDLGYIDSQNDWMKIAIENNLKETDYSDKTTKLLKVSLANNENNNSTSVVDVMRDANILGKDIDKRILFENDDLKYLDPKETINQSAEILLSIKKGSIPEYPDYGVSSELLGSNIRSFQYPVLFRQLTDVFRKDDTFKEIQITDIIRSQDNISLSVNLKDRLGDSINTYLRYEV